MERSTVDIYEVGAAEWAARRPPRFVHEARSLVEATAPGGVTLDVGCGPGTYLAILGRPVLALDAAHAMVRLARDRAPDAWCVQADLEHLPLRAGAAASAWARASYLHVPRAHLPLALADLHRAVRVGAPVDLTMKAGSYEGNDLRGDDFPGRFYACWHEDGLADTLVGAGFTVDRIDDDREWVRARITRARTLPDYVSEGMRLLVCGLNPSVYAADVGMGFGRPGNRFWPAAIAAGIVTHDRDPRAALAGHHVGMTDLVKRATRAASEIGPDEYRAGAERLARLVAWLRPKVVCFVGLAGYRVAIERRASAGTQPDRFAGAATYVMPNPSGLNTHDTVASLAAHLLAAWELAD